jgi:hypothetical protein
VGLFCVCAALCVGRADIPSKESYRLHINYETEKGAKAEQRVVEL